MQSKIRGVSTDIMIIAIGQVFNCYYHTVQSTRDEAGEVIAKVTDNNMSV